MVGGSGAKIEMGSQFADRGHWSVSLGTSERLHNFRIAVCSSRTEAEQKRSAKQRGRGSKKPALLTGC